MNSELLRSIENIEKEKNISKEVLFEALRLALISACKKTFSESETEEFDVQIDQETGEFKLIQNGKQVQSDEFGRIAAQTAKQVIIQKIREAERESIYNEYSKRLNEIISGTVHRIEKRSVLVDFGKTEGILPQREQCYLEQFQQGNPIKVYVVDVKKTSRGPEIILSRSHPELVRCLFEIEVPEISENIVQIKGVAREAGARTKIAVTSNDEKIDCVGSCVGMRGQRVKNIVRELQGEKIDIVRWSDDAETYIKNALSPAQLSEVNLEKDSKTANVLVADDQLSLAIGKKGQNVRLASKLTGWKLEIRSASQKISLADLEGIGEKTQGLLKAAGITTLKDVLKASVEELSEIKGLGPKTAQKIIDSAHQVLMKSEEKKLPSLTDLAQNLKSEKTESKVDDLFEKTLEAAKLEEAKSKEDKPGSELFTDQPSTEKAEEVDGTEETVPDEEDKE